ncbi:MAG: hypothetical protein V3S28_04755 [Acidimicrobiia bacterium]
MPRCATILVVLGIAAASCQSSAARDATSTTVPAPPATNQEALETPDRIVVATTSGAIVVHGVGGGELMRIDPSEDSIFRQPTWLDASTIVFSEVSETGDHALIAADAETGDVVWRAEMETPPFYFLPAPMGSPYATTSLRNDPAGAGLIAELVDRSGETTALSNESPFYTSWSPDGQDLGIHIAGRRLDVSGATGTATITSRTGLFQTPVWIDMGLMTLRTVEGTQSLAVWDNGSFNDIATLEGPAGFVAFGDRVAVQPSVRPDTGSVQVGLVTQQLPSVPGGRLVVIDLLSGSMETVSTELALVYQWDQVGERLLYATVGSGPVSLIWHQWSGGDTAEITSFTPQPPWFRNFVPFFDQYAQSVQFWSASGDHIGYPAVIGGAPVVVIQSVDGSGSIIIPDASWSAWAPRS